MTSLPAVKNYMSVDPEPQFLDTNVLIYAYDSSTGEVHHAAKELLKSLWSSRKGCLSIQVLQEFYVNITRKVPHPLDLEAAAQIVFDLSTWRVHEPQIEDVHAAIRIHRHHGISFWDAMILQSAVRLGCDVIFSEDLNADQEYEGVKVINPFS